MSDPAPARTVWVQPVLLAVATAAALGFGFLYFTRPNAGELGAIRVVVADENGKSRSAIHVIVAEARLSRRKPSRRARRIRASCITRPRTSRCRT